MHMLLLDSVERGTVPPSPRLSQLLNHGNLTHLPGRKFSLCFQDIRLEEWLPTGQRNEAFVVVILGAELDCGRYRRCMESLRGQTYTSWGCVLVADGCSAEFGTFVEMDNKEDPRVTVLRPRCKRGYLPNLLMAARHVCKNPLTVLVTLVSST